MLRKVFMIFSVLCCLSCGNITAENRQLTADVISAVLGMAIQTYIDQNGPYVSRDSPRGDSSVEIVNYETYAVKAKNGRIIAIESRQ